MDRIASPRRVDQARLNSLVEASLAEVGSAPPIPGSFLTRPRRIMEDTFEGWEAPDFGSPLRTARKVNPKFVSCNPPSAAITAITGPDPAGVIQAANTRAIALLDYVIRDLQDKRDQIRSGATTTDVVEDLPTRESLRTRFHMNADDRRIWTATGARSVLTLIKRFRGARQILADGWMKYTCVGGASFPLGNCGRLSCSPGDQAWTCPGHSRIVLCAAFWTDSPDGQAGTLVHEALHIYFGFIGDQESGNFANAHCYEQFVLDMNWLDVPAAFVGSCP